MPTIWRQDRKLPTAAATATTPTTPPVHRRTKSANIAVWPAAVITDFSARTIENAPRTLDRARGRV
jgi:hypothetical protein